MTPVIDIHCHAAPAPGIAALVQGVVRPEDDPASFFSSPDSLERNRTLGREQYGLALTSLDERLARMDRSRVQIQAVSPSPQQFYWAEAELGARLSRLQNEHVAGLVAQRPARLTGLGSVPLQDPRRAVAELEYLLGELGLRGVQISTYVAGRELGDAGLEPFWEAAEALGAVVFMHPLGFSHGERMREFYLNNAIAHPLESALALASLIFNGVFRRHPALKLVVAHGGGYLPFHPSRLDHAWEVRPECRVHIDRRPSEYLKQIYVDTVVYTPESVAQLVSLVGADHVLLGTDYPFDMGEADPVGLVHFTPRLTGRQREAICGGNAARLLGLGAG
ncbi:MAG: amidohydrolase [Chloroflexi bacterium]|nr:amidohydrolase [Chloroflexota bacterium]